MELDITDMVNDSVEMPNLSGSCLEHGADAGQITWDNAKDYASVRPILNGHDEIEQAIRHLREFGAWSEEEIRNWPINELNAVMIQLIAGDIREMEACGTYEEYLVESERGTVPSNIFRADDGRWYYQVG